MKSGNQDGDRGPRQGKGLRCEQCAQMGLGDWDKNTLDSDGNSGPKLE